MIPQVHIIGIVLSKLLAINRFGDPILSNEGLVYLIVTIK